MLIYSFGAVTRSPSTSIAWSTCGYRAVVDKSYGRRPQLLHTRFIDQASAGYCSINIKASQWLFTKAFCNFDVALCSEHGPRENAKATPSNAVVGMIDPNAVDVVILSNGPGEVVTWVKPVVRALRQYFKAKRSNIRISVLLCPCPHASGEEMKVIQSFEEVDRCLGPDRFLQLVFLGDVQEGWEWRKKGVCIFLGGDQFNAVVLGKKLGYRTIIYCEDCVRWPCLVDIYALPSQSMIENVPQWAQSTCRVVGDLSRDAVYKSECFDSSEALTEVTPVFGPNDNSESIPIVGILPGSKNVKLSIGLPYFMAVAEHIQERMGKNVRFILPLAPTVTLSKLEQYADPNQNKFISKFQWGSGELVMATSNEHSSMIANLVSEKGSRIEIWQVFPPYKLYKECTLCLTTIGINTAELGYLGVPMVVVLPTHILQVFRGATGGLMGLLLKVPGMIGDMVAYLMNFMKLKTFGFVSWPNRWAKEEIIPELIGRIKPKDVAIKVIKLLESPSTLKNMQSDLLRVGNEQKQKLKLNEVEHQDGPAIAIASIVDDLVNT